ncbi:competence protein ComER [Sporolactobacillus laevolacticus DSM 442]|uniref:Pyrroline-5-carboxylate reductase n=1 Tax=Sporolactobacillus laevolacticus DSM 442 TaxID=1395513 RepID=V6J2J9_9BACL|nr:late competence protein ComER [Sporolactobacillus laevolacticus]EST13386.1 competence protein ComER [Sporolactobacillus laevolacticus DSM 442]
MRIGVIGTGNMGSLIVDALVRSKATRPRFISVTNRTKQKALELAKKYRLLSVYSSPNEILQHADIVFLCVKPAEFHPLLQTLRGRWHPKQLAISITSPISVTQLESLIPCQVARVIPSIVNQSLSGSTLVTFGSSVTDVQKSKLWAILSQFSHPIEIDEENVRVASDISSCGPAFLSYLLQRMIDGAVSSTSISKKQATQLTTEMVAGLGKIFEEHIYTLEELQKKVTVKGGVTGVGLAVLEQEISDVFEKLFTETQKKFIEDRHVVNTEFNGD